MARNNILGGGNPVSQLAEQAQNRISGMGGRNEEQATGSEPGEIDWFEVSTFTATGNNLVQNEEVRVFEYTVPAQTGYVWGFGEPQPGKSDNQGAIYADGQDSGTNDLSGWWRLRSENAVGKDVDDHGRFSTGRLSAPGASDPDNWLNLPERNMPVVAEDSKVYVTFEADNTSNAGNSVDTANTQFTTALTQFTEGEVPGV